MVWSKMQLQLCQLVISVVWWNADKLGDISYLHIIPWTWIYGHSKSMLCPHSLQVLVFFTWVVRGVADSVSMWDAVERVTSFATQLPSELPSDEAAAEAAAAVPLLPAKRGKSMAHRTGSTRQPSVTDRRTAEQRLADTAIRMSHEGRAPADLTAPGSAAAATKAAIRSSMEGVAPAVTSTAAVVTEENGNIVLSEIRIVTAEEKKDKLLANWPATGGCLLLCFNDTHKHPNVFFYGLH